ncbi:MAG: NAD(P)/FAD-dependent oxidoreductase, partial [Xanthobacteraceae bacterium]
MNIVVNRSDNSCNVAIIGAGPYGLAAAAHLRAVNVSVRVFGEGMSFWRRHMPSGMKLRSPWIATHIADPLHRYRLDDYFGETGLPLPELLPVENFIDYGTWFQDQVAPDLDTRTVVRVAPRDGGFRIVLEDGENVFARRVVMATGLLHHEHRPAQFDGLPRSLVSHSCEHTDSAQFRGRRVAVIGRGQSACESAALLHEADADVEIICHGHLVWNADPGMRGALRKGLRSLLGKALIPPSQVGPFPFNWLVEAPALIRHLSAAARDRLNEHCLHPTAILWLRPRLQDIPRHEGTAILEAHRDGDRIVLKVDGNSRRVDHVLLATGYRISVDKMDILDPRLRSRIVRHADSPVCPADLNRASTGCISSTPPPSRASGRCCGLSQAPDLPRAGSLKRCAIAAVRHAASPTVTSIFCRENSRRWLTPNGNGHDAARGA